MALVFDGGNAVWTGAGFRYPYSAFPDLPKTIEKEIVVTRMWNRDLIYHTPDQKFLAADRKTHVTMDQLAKASHIHTVKDLRRVLALDFRPIYHWEDYFNKNHPDYKLGWLAGAFMFSGDLVNIDGMEEWNEVPVRASIAFKAKGWAPFKDYFLELLEEILDIEDVDRYVLTQDSKYTTYTNNTLHLKTSLALVLDEGKTQTLLHLLKLALCDFRSFQYYQDWSPFFKAGFLMNLSNTRTRVKKAIAKYPNRDQSSRWAKGADIRENKIYVTAGGPDDIGWDLGQKISKWYNEFGVWTRLHKNYGVDTGLSWLIEIWDDAPDRFFESDNLLEQHIQHKQYYDINLAGIKKNSLEIGMSVFESTPLFSQEGWLCCNPLPGVPLPVSHFYAVS